MEITAPNHLLIVYRFDGHGNEIRTWATGGERQKVCPTTDRLARDNSILIPIWSILLFVRKRPSTTSSLVARLTKERKFFQGARTRVKELGNYNQMTEHTYSTSLALTAFAASVVVVHVIGLHRRSQKNSLSKLGSAGVSSDTLASTVASDENDMSVHIKDFTSEYIPGEYMPGCPPDSVVKYYCKDTITDAAFQEVPRAIDPKDQDTPDEWVPRHPDLVRLTGRHPFNCEAPLKQLYAKGFITPTSLHYVRNHGAAPKICWVSEDDQ